MKTQASRASQIRHGVYGVLGHRISYSQSPAIFRCVFNALRWPAVYALFDLPERRLGRFVTAAVGAGITGFNVTTPYKVRILDYLDALDPAVKAIGAVNTVTCRGGKLIGSNTDSDGIEAALNPYRRQLRRASVVILGAGGAARALAYTLDRRFKVSSIVFAVRSLPKGRRLVRDLARHSRVRCHLTARPIDRGSLQAVLSDAALLVNATPVGSGSSAARTLLPRTLDLPRQLIVFDLIYHPRPTRLLRHAQQAGCRTIDGWGMLVAQAEAAFRLWTGRGFPARVRSELASTGKLSE